MTTVGYGDEYPQTTLGRLYALAVMLVGIGFIAILTGAIAERFLASQIGVNGDRHAHPSKRSAGLSASGLLPLQNGDRDTSSRSRAAVTPDWTAVAPAPTTRDATPDTSRRPTSPGSTKHQRFQ